MNALHNHGGRLTLPGPKPGESTVIESGAYLQPVPAHVGKHPVVQKQVAARKASGGVGGIEEIG